MLAAPVVPPDTSLRTLLIELWSVWLPYLVAGVVLLALGAWSAVSVAARRRGRPEGARWVGPPPAFLVPAVCLVVLAGIALSLADAVREGDGLSDFDEPVLRWMVEHRSPAVTVLAKVVTEVGSTVGMTVIGAAAVVVLWLRRRRGDAGMVAVVGIGAAALVFFSKRIVGRTRPPAEFRLAAEDTLSFPSGHALASTAVLGVLVVLLVRGRTPAARLRAVLVVLIALFWLSIGLSRLYLGVHWATDVLGGWTSGAAWLLVCLTVRRLARSYRDNRRAGATTGTDPGVTDDDRETGTPAVG